MSSWAITSSRPPLAVSPVFLKSPQRVEALICLLQIALQAYQMLERHYRQSVPENASAQEKRMTSERLLRVFEVHGLLVRTSPIGRVVHPTTLSPEKQRILKQLKLPAPDHLLTKKTSPGRPAPPTLPSPHPEPHERGCGI